MTLAVEAKEYQADAIVVEGTEFALCAMPHRKRLKPVVMRVTSDLLRMVLALRNEGIPAVPTTPAEDLRHAREVRSRLQSRVDKQATAIAAYENIIDEQRTTNEELGRRLAELQDGYIERGDELGALRARDQMQAARIEMLQRHNERLKTAICQVLQPNDPFSGWKLIHVALGNALVRKGYHSRARHPWWSLDFWFGCGRCVSEWMLHSPEDVPEHLAEIPQSVFKAMNRQIYQVLQPALIQEAKVPKLKPEPSERLRAIAALAVVDPGAAGMAAPDTSGFA